MKAENLEKAGVTFFAMRRLQKDLELIQKNPVSEPFMLNRRDLSQPVVLELSDVEGSRLAAAVLERRILELKDQLNQLGVEV